MRRECRFRPGEAGLDAWDVDGLLLLSRELPAEVVGIVWCYKSSATAATGSAAAPSAGSNRSGTVRPGTRRRAHRDERRQLPPHVSVPARARNASIGLAHGPAQLEGRLAVKAQVLVQSHRPEYYGLRAVPEARDNVPRARPSCCNDMHVVTNDLDPLLAGVAGTRVAWERVPAGVRLSVEDYLGSRVEGARSQEHGFSPAVAARLRLADGRRVFVKAIGPDHETGAPGGQESYRREAAVTSQLPKAVPCPALLRSWEAEDWVVLLFEAIDGHNPYMPWRRDQLDRVLAALEDVARAVTPSPVAVPLASNPGGSHHWREVAADPARLEQLKGWVPWLGGYLHLLAELEISSDQACAGDTLLHFDLRADNIVLTSSNVYIVDWAHARVGAPWVDLVYFLPSVAMQGGPSPQDLFWDHPSSEAAARADVMRVLAGFAGFLLEGATQPPPPGLPGLRRFQLAQGVEAARWFRHLAAVSG
jgi:Phosphotransferase enzyme family